MDKMDRDAALRVLATDRVSRMSESTLKDHLYADYLDRTTGEPLPYETVYDADVQAFLVRLLTETKLMGVSNRFLGAYLTLSLGRPTTVDGQEPALLACPCCSHLILKARGEYDICPVCDWEDDGSNCADSFSSVNHGSMVSYRADNAEQILMRGARYRRAPATD